MYLIHNVIYKNFLSFLNWSISYIFTLFCLINNFIHSIFRAVNGHPGPPLALPLYNVCIHFMYITITYDYRFGAAKSISIINQDNALLSQSIWIIVKPLVLNSERIEEAIGFTMTTIVYVNYKFRGSYRAPNV